MALQKAFFKNLETDEKITVRFNPADLSFNKTAQFAEIGIPGLDSPVLQFTRGGSETLRIELFFDTTDYGMGENAKSVTDDIIEGEDIFAGTDKFYQLVKQNPNLHAPPRCLFSWGASSPQAGQAGQFANPSGNSLNEAVSKAPFWFTCIVESVERKFLLFSPGGVPLRARLTVAMREYKTVEQMVAELQSADHTKARVIKRRERLDQISAAEYDTPAEWRRIAEENGLDDPLRVAPGTLLKIPPMKVSSAIRKGSA